ncbi:MAG: TfoX/Sxy family protein, partial [Armatimonadota bacterium]
MATQQSTVDQLLVHLSAAGDVTAKKMFGEYGIYFDGKMFGMV